jgi:hypothetical protein
MSLYEITNPNNVNKNVDLYVNNIRCNNLNASGANITCDYLTTNNTVHIGASGLSASGVGLTVENGGIELVYGSINNNYCCQITKFAAQAITSGSFVKITGLQSSNTYGFNNTLGTMADNSTSEIVIRKTGKYFVSMILYGDIGTTIFEMQPGLNGSVLQINADTRNQGYQSKFFCFLDLTVNDRLSMYCAVATNGNVSGAASYQGAYINATLIN